MKPAKIVYLSFLVLLWILMVLDFVFSEGKWGIRISLMICACAIGRIFGETMAVQEINQELEKQKAIDNTSLTSNSEKGGKG